MRLEKLINFREINPDNWRIKLTVSEQQKNYVANQYTLLARSYAYRNYRSRAFIIYMEDEPIGMALYYDEDDLKAYNFSEFFIDERYQERGFGITSAKMVLDMMKRDGKYNKVILCYINGNEAAKNLYEKLGFKETAMDEDEVIMEKKL